MSETYSLFYTTCAVVGMSSLAVTLLSAPVAVIAAIWDHDTAAKVAFTAMVIGITLFVAALYLTPRA